MNEKLKMFNKKDREIAELMARVEELEEFFQKAKDSNIEKDLKIMSLQDEMEKMTEVIKFHDKDMKIKEENNQADFFLLKIEIEQILIKVNRLSNLDDWDLSFLKD